jgi:hypothetical protein
MMALYFQILANSELDIELYGKAIYMHYEFRGGEGRGRGRLFPFCGLVALLAKLTQFGLHVKH